MYELKVVTRFAAAHQLTMVGKKCENLHGHNWRIEVHVGGRELDAGGVLLDFGVLKRKLNEVMDLLDHRFLNEQKAFADNPPSSENIARFVADELARRVDSDRIRVTRVSAWESDDSCATYIPG
ncbi:MAG: 6-carboxytetrahydropterin synthase QueD [Desulfatibacillaceae bacterium]